MVKREQLPERAHRRDYLVGVRAKFIRGSAAVAFDGLIRTMQFYKSVIADNMTFVLLTDNDLCKFLKGMSPSGEVVLDQDRGGN